jgi:hypothetical protein
MSARSRPIDEQPRRTPSFVCEVPRLSAPCPGALPALSSGSGTAGLQCLPGPGPPMRAAGARVQGLPVCRDTAPATIPRGGRAVARPAPSPAAVKRGSHLALADSSGRAAQVGALFWVRSSTSGASAERISCLSIDKPMSPPVCANESWPFSGSFRMGHRNRSDTSDFCRVTLFLHISRECGSGWQCPASFAIHLTKRALSAMILID